MKTRKHFYHRLASVATLGFLTQIAPAQTWQTVLDYQYSPGFYSDKANALAFDPMRGTVLAVGYGEDPVSWSAHGMTFGSGDAGGNWYLLDDAATPQCNTYYLGAVATTAGSLFTCGYMTQNGRSWLARGSFDGGLTWITLDSFAPPYTSNQWALSIAAEDNNIYVLGSVATNGVNRSLIRKSMDQGQTWTTIWLDASSYFRCIFSHPSLGLFLAGWWGTEPYWWRITRSLDHGATWKQMDSFYLDKRDESTADAISADPFGNLYAVGWADQPYKGRRQHYWITRKSSDRGNTWTTVDSVLMDCLSGAPLAVAADAKGNVYAGGNTCIPDPNNPGYATLLWTVRKQAAGAATWTTVDSFQYEPNKSSTPNAIVGDAAGNMFVAGSGATSTTGTHWIIRKLPPTQ